MKYICSLAVLAVVSASSDLSIGEVVASPNEVVDMQTVSELHTEMMAEVEAKAERATRLRDKINERESSLKSQRLYFLINQKLNDPTFIQMASADHDETNTAGRNIIKQDQGVNSQSEDHKEPTSDYSGERVADLIIPGHIPPEKFEASKAGAKSGTGLSIVTLTMDNLDNTELFMRKIFHEGLCSKAQIIDGGFERAYLKFGELHEEGHRVYVEMTTTQDKIADLLNYINKHPGTSYDYPVPDLTVLAVKDGSKSYVEWALAAVENGKKIKLTEEIDHINIVDK